MNYVAPTILAAVIAQAIPPIRSYSELMTAPPQEREQLFASAPPDIRARIKRQHLEAWLRVHQPDLSRRQIAIVREVIAFVTPSLYSAEPDPKSRAAVDKMSQRLACAIGADLAPTLAQISEPPKRIRRTWKQRATNWIDWVVSCVV